MTDWRDGEMLAELHSELLAELTGQLDVDAGLVDIEAPHADFGSMLLDIEARIDLNVGLDDILPRPTLPADRRRSNARSANEPTAAKSQSAGGKTNVITLIDAALDDLGDMYHWANSSSTLAQHIDGSVLEGAEVHLRQLSKGISDGSLTLDGALWMVREAARNVNDFMSEGFPIAVGLTVRRAMERFQHLEAILPRLFDDSGNMTKAPR
jgi:hypothetical protein